MSKASRDKGQRGEREVCALLTEKLGGEFKRNLMQTAEGGHDVLGLEYCALEVKRCETLAVDAWWEQTKEQADEVEAYPVLFYRKSRQPWSVVISLEMINEVYSAHNCETLAIADMPVTMSVDTFLIIYERMMRR